MTDPPIDLSVGDIDRKLRPNGYRYSATVTMESLKPPSLFLMASSLTPYDLPFPQNGGSICPQNMRMVISATGDPIHFMFGSRVGFSGAYSGFEVRGREMWSGRSSAEGTRMEAPKAPTGVGSGDGVSPPQWRWSPGRGLCPLRRKILACSPSKWCVLMHSGAL